MMKKPSKEDILRRIGSAGFGRSSDDVLGDIVRGGSRGSDLGAEFMGEAYRGFARIVAKKLVSAPNQRISVFQLIEAMDSTVEDLLPVLRWMEERGYVKVADRPKSGDWVLQSTEDTPTLS